MSGLRGDSTEDAMKIMNMEKANQKPSLSEFESNSDQSHEILNVNGVGIPSKNRFVSPAEREAAAKTNGFFRNEDNEGKEANFEQIITGYNGFLGLSSKIRKIREEKRNMNNDDEIGRLVDEFMDKVVKTWTQELSQGKPLTEATALLHSKPNTVSDPFFTYKYTCNAKPLGCVMIGYEKDIIKDFKGRWKTTSDKFIDYYKSLYKKCNGSEDCLKENRPSVEAAYKDYKNWQTQYFNEAEKIFYNAIPNKREIPEEITNSILGSDKEFTELYLKIMGTKTDKK
jgi:hypothetical protein